MSRPQQPTGLVDARVLLVALVVCAPAGYQMMHGMLSLSDVLTRYLVVAVGCVAVSAVVRFVWPILAGELGAPAPATAGPAGRTAASAATRSPDASVPSLDDDTALLSSFDDPAASLLASGVDDDYLELSSPPALD